MLAVSVVTRQPPRAMSGSSRSSHSRSPTGVASRSRTIVGVVRMQVNLDVARGDGQQAHGVPHDADDLRGIERELAPHQVLGDDHREPRELVFDAGIEIIEWLGERLDDGRQRRDLDVDFGDANLELASPSASPLRTPSTWPAL